MNKSCRIILVEILNARTVTRNGRKLVAMVKAHRGGEKDLTGLVDKKLTMGQECAKRCKWYPGEEHCQKIEVGDPAPLLYLGEATKCCVQFLGSSIQDRQGTIGGSGGVLRR
ncbi:hypothetical protein BTVI_54832 [Pitangus sulphuratus]|nr:hypothetical protein BTVI_54832 [Pitangus sulphuratus]